MGWTEVLALIGGILMLFVMWPAYKHWSQNGPKAEQGDWAAAALPLGAVILLVLLLIASVQ